MLLGLVIAAVLSIVPRDFVARESVDLMELNRCRGRWCSARAITSGWAGSCATRGRPERPTRWSATRGGRS